MEKIKNTFSKLKKINYKPHIIIAAICLMISAQIMKTSLIKTHDGFLHFLRVIGSYKEIKNYGDIPIIIKDFAKRMGICTKYIL